MKRMLLSVGIAAVLGIGGAQAAGDVQAARQGRCLRRVPWSKR